MSTAHHTVINRLNSKCRQIMTVGIVVLSALFLSTSIHSMGLDEAVNKVQSELGGKVLDVQRVTVQHAPAYRIKLLQPSGRVQVLLIDANSGALLTEVKPKKGR